MTAPTLVMLPASKHRPVLVERDGAWFWGWLEAYREQPGRGGDSWRGFVRYTVDVGETHTGWFSEDQVKVDEPASRTPPVP